MYVVLMGACVLVFASLMPKSGSAKEETSPQVVREMEETMEGFLAELEEDNRKLIDTIAAMKQEHNQTIARLADRMDGMEKHFQEERRELRRFVLEQAGKLERAVPLPVSVNAANIPSPAPASPAAAAPSPPEPKQTTIKSRYEELFRMHEEGKSVEYIARKTGMNKGEVSLIIQLAVQEEHKGVEK